MAKHKASPPSQQMYWLGLDFDSVLMTITIPPIKMDEITNLVTKWQPRSHADLHALRVLCGKLHNITQCCPPHHFTLVGLLLFNFNHIT